MTTTTAKKLRDNLSEYLDRLQRGEEIVIIRHSEIIGVLKPTQNLRINNGSTLAAMFNRNKDFFSSNKGKVNASIPTDELYHHSLNESYQQ